MEKMQCPNCGQTNNVTIGDNTYCASCGSLITASGHAAPSTAPMVDVVKPVATPTPSSSAPAPIATVFTATPPAPVATNLHSQVQSGPRRLMDIKPVAAPSPTTPPATPPRIAATPAQDRLERAAAVPKSELIQKFNPALPTEINLPEVAPIVAPIPAANLPAIATPVAPVATKGKKPWTKAKLTTIAGGALAIAILGSVAWLQNYPKMSIRLAASRAGVAASIPDYLPAGYHLSGPVAYAPGQLTLTFASDTSKDSVVITQRKTDWDASSLVANYVAKIGKYTTVEDQGLSIYFYSDNHASWVNHGVWYNIEGTAKLKQDQVLKIVSSL